MKKILAIVMTVAMILAMGTVFASAAERGNTPGAYVIGPKDQFEPAGDIEIEWVADAAEKITFDGDLSDWADFEGTIIGPENMVSWVGYNEDKKTNGEGAAVDEAMPKDWQITSYYLADPDYLYVGFYIVDDNVVATPDIKNYQQGDAFQINIDFGRKLGDVIEYDPDTVLIMDDLQNPFYSFAYAGDKVATAITRQRTTSRDCTLTEADNGVIAFTGATTDGWCAEFRLPWEELYLDYADKAWIDNLKDFSVYMGGDENKPLQLGIGLYYQNHSLVDGADSGINWAAGTHSGSCDTNIVPSGAPIVGWDAYDTAITLKLMPQEGISFTSENIKVLASGETEPDTKKPSEVWDETEPTDDADDTTAAETTAAETTAAGTTADTTAADTAAEGCTSVLGASAAVVLAAAAAVVLKKKD